MYGQFVGQSTYLLFKNVTASTPCRNNILKASFATTQSKHRKGFASRKDMRDPWTAKSVPDLRIPVTTPESSLFKPAPHNPWSQRTVPPPPDLLNNPIHYNSEARPGEATYHKEVTMPGTGNKKYKWPTYNEHIHRPDGTYRPAYVCHMRGCVKYSPEKLWHVATLVAGMSIDEALKQLEFNQLKGARIVSEVIEEARELALNEHNFEHASNMWVAESFANQAMIYKGVRRHARMRIGTISYRFSNYFVKLEEGRPPKNYYEWKAKKTPHEMLQDYITEHRNKRIFFD